MRRIGPQIVILTLCAITMTSCAKMASPTPPVAGKVCDGVFAMVGQEITAKYDISTARLVAGKIVAAAQADVGLLKGVKEGKLDVGAEAKLGSELKAVVETKSKVTTDFFQQDQSFAQAACFMDSVLTKSGLSAADQAFFEEQRRALAANRVSYLDVLTGLKKK